MFKHLRANIVLLVLTALVASVLYPLTILAIGQSLFPERASCSLIIGPDGKPVGSRLIAQEFQGEQWFHPRPSSVSYAANASGGSNLAANNPRLQERVTEALKHRAEKQSVPADAVTTSGSGLDPHITLRNARGQLDRITAAWAARTKRDPAEIRVLLEAVLTEASFKPLLGLAGSEPLVNALEVNGEIAWRLK